MRKSLITFFLSLFLCDQLRCDTIAYITSYEEGAVYVVSLNRGLVLSRILVGAHPFYVASYEDILFLDGPNEKRDGAYIQVFDRSKGQTVKRITTGVICCSMMTERTVVYAIAEPAAEIIIMDLESLTTRSIRLPDKFLPVALTKTRNPTELLVLASQYLEPGKPKQTVCYVISTSSERVIGSFDVPKWSDGILQTDGRNFVSTSVNSPEGAPFPFFYTDSLESGSWTKFYIPFFCEQYGNRQKSFVVPRTDQLVYSAGDCPGDAELELKEPTLLAVRKDGSVLWSVTEDIDKIPSANTIAPLPDGRIAFVSRGWGVGVWNPRTRELTAHFSIGDNASIWGIAVHEEHKTAAK